MANALEHQFYIDRGLKLDVFNSHRVHNNHDFCLSPIILNHFQPDGGTGSDPIRVWRFNNLLVWLRRIVDYTIDNGYYEVTACPSINGSDRGA